MARGTVRGRREGAGVPGLWVEAFDLDRLERADRLGEARTDAEGGFSIEFGKRSFAHSLSEALAKPGPTLLVTVRDEDGVLLHMTMPRPSASREEEFEIVLDPSARAPTEAPGDGPGPVAADPTAYWTGLLGLPAETDTYALRRGVRRLREEQIRRLDPSQRTALRSFASLSVAFPPRVAWALARCGVADLVTLREWPVARVRNALAVAGLPEREIDSESRRFERLLALSPEDRPEDLVTGIDIDVQDRSVLSRSDWDELRRRDICTLEDWRSQRDELGLSSDGRAALDCYLRLMSLGLSPEMVDRFRRSGLTGARVLAGLGEQDIAKRAEDLRISPAELGSILARAGARVAAIEDDVVRIVREDRIGECRWIEEAGGVSLTPPVDAFPDHEASERFGYLSYLRHLAGDSAGAVEGSPFEGVFTGAEAWTLEPVARVTVWNEVLERERGEALDFDDLFAARRRLLEARLQIGRLSPVDLAGGDTNLELRLRAALVAPFAPPGRFTPAELALLEDRAEQAARRQMEQRVEAGPEFAEVADDVLAAEVERRLALRLAPAMLDAEILRYQALRRLDGRDDDAFRTECLVDPSLPARGTTTRLDEAVVAMTILLEAGESRNRALSFRDWRKRRAVLLWPHTDSLRRDGSAAPAASADPFPARLEGALAEVDRLVREAEDRTDIESGEAGSLLDEARRALRSAVAEAGASSGSKLLRARLGRLLLRRASLLARADLPEATNEAVFCCRAVLSVHDDPEFADRLGLGETPAVLCGLLGQSTSRARREGDLPGLVRSVDRVLEAQVAARLSGASGAEIASACRSQAPAAGMAPREATLKALAESLRSLSRPPLRPTEPIRVRYDRLVDLGEILLPGVQGVTVERQPERRGCSPLELLLAAPLPSRDPVGDRQKLAAVLKLEEIRGGSALDAGPRQEEPVGPGDSVSADIVRGATLQLSRCSMFVRRFDQLLSTGAGLHERAVSTTARLAAEAGVPPLVEQVAFEARAQQWVDIVATTPECIASAAAKLRSGLELNEREGIRALADRSAEMAFVGASGEGSGASADDGADSVPALVRPAPGSAPVHTLDGPWHLTKVLSLARLMPADLQAFREGYPLLAFRMLSRWFDEEFPRHCDRKIQGIGIKLTVADDRPVMAGVRLWSSGIAFALSGPDLEERIQWRQPCLASLSAHRPAPDSPLLETPVDLTSFAGVDLDSDWVLEISDEVESVDPATVVDVELVVEYSAYGEYGQVWSGATRPRSTVRERLLSMRHDFPEAWQAVVQGSTGRFLAAERTFGGRMEELAIVDLSLHPVSVRGAPEGAGSLRLDTSAGLTVEGRAELVDGIASTRSQGGEQRHPWSAFLGVSPVGEWQIALEPPPGLPAPATNELRDLVLAITYSGVVGLRQD